ncbi:ABC transporter permease [Mycoplasmatota bacterium]|nr:ABC transporter permease [Mycoplasmatota bacterium]
MDTLYFLLRLSLFSAIPLMVVALGGMFSEKSGVVNIALEGLMLIGAFTGIYALNLMQKAGMSGQMLYIYAMLVGGVMGLIFSLLHAYASVNMKANQVISGTALNLFTPALAIFLARMWTGTQQVNFNDMFFIQKVGFLANIPVIGDLFFQKAYISTYVGILILIISYYVLYKTKFGLRLRSCGEHPQAADAAGISVYKIRYAGVMISGFLAGLGGVILIVPTTTNFNATVSGFGFLALAVLIFGQWKPKRIMLAALFFGLMRVISNSYSLIDVLAKLKLPGEFYSIIPYVATLVVLAFVSKKSAAPLAAGTPYDQGKR